MRLYLFRHGEAGPYVADDANRELTERGRRQAQASALALAPLKLDYLISSPFVRAVQTADIIAEHCEIDKRIQWHSVQPEGDPASVLDVIDQLNAESVMIVAHQPFLGCLVSLCVEGRAFHSPVLPMLGTANCACLTMDVVAPGCADLVKVQLPGV